MVHWWLANAGLASMVTGFFLVPSFDAAGRAVLVAGGTMAAVGAFCFIVNIWRTVDLGSDRAAAVKLQGRTVLPVKEAIV
jgi:hypothetical protein